MVLSNSMIDAPAATLRSAAAGHRERSPHQGMLYR